MRKILICLLMLVSLSAYGQSYSGAIMPSMRAGATLPLTCNANGADIFFFKNSGTVGVYRCSAANTWTFYSTAPSAASPLSVDVHTVTAAATGPQTAANSDSVVLSYSTTQKGVTAAMTGTTSTQVIAAVASNYIYLTSCSFSNTHASVTTMMSLQDGSAGTTIWSGIVPFGGGSNVVFPTPLKVTTLGNGAYVVNVTTGSNTFASCSGFSSTVSY